MEPWQARQSSGLAFANSRAALITAFALDHLGASDLADDFKQLLATIPPDVLADERAALRIPDDYVLQIPTGEPQPLSQPARPPRRVRRPHQRPAHQLTCDIGSTRSHQRRTPNEDTQDGLECLADNAPSQANRMNPEPIGRRRSRPCWCPKQRDTHNPQTDRGALRVGQDHRRGRKLRYRGRQRNRAWWLFTGAVYNLVRITALDSAAA